MDLWFAIALVWLALCVGFVLGAIWSWMQR